MTIEIGSWYFITFAVAIGVAVAFFVLHQKTQQYRLFVVGKVKVIVHRNTGWPLTKVVEETPDGWVRVGKGDYRLPKDDEQKAIFDKLPEEERHRLLGEKQVVPPAMEWTFYPETPLLGIKSTRVPIRTVHFDENDPRPRTWLREHETEVTAVLAQAHTRQMDALQAGIRAEELDKQNKQIMHALGNLMSKNIQYIMGVGSIVLSVVILILLYRGE
jgi:hypothetical protein